MNKALYRCIICNILVLCIFVPWYSIISNVSFLETIIVFSMYLLIGKLLAIVIQSSLVMAHISSIVLYVALFIKCRTNKVVQMWLIPFTAVFVLSIVYYTYIVGLYTAVFTLHWWGNTKDFILPT